MPSHTQLIVFPGTTLGNAPTRPRHEIDVALSSPKRPGSGFHLGADNVTDDVLLLVNRHHQKVKAEREASSRTVIEIG